MTQDSDLCKFGTPLDPLVEDEIPSKKPIGIEDQIAVDSNGKRRFHGAFTGGFSAGFWNTVGSEEGWQPQQFKSSRTEKANRSVLQRPEDFMDDEDLGEFGIAPQRVQTKDDFTPQDRLNKRKFQKLPDGPIPGIPVLHSLVAPARENVGVRLLCKMGWKQGQGIGARLTYQEKRQTARRNKKELYVMKKYGCDMGPNAAAAMNEQTDDTNNESEGDESDLSETEITFAPDDFDPFVMTLKDNLFGLGYSGLNRNPVLNQRSDLFAPLELVDRNNKKLKITGQAFGVGAFEEEDDDIYVRDDMSRYDFSLDDKKTREKKAIEAAASSHFLEGFTIPKSSNTIKKPGQIYKVGLPAKFTPRNWTMRRTRFEPLDDDTSIRLQQQDGHKKRGLGRHDLKPDERGRLLNEDNALTVQEPVDGRSKHSEPAKDKKTALLEKINAKYDKFEKREILNDSESIIVDPVAEALRRENEKTKAEAEKITKNLSILSNAGVFKPFLADAPKQIRYEQFLECRETSTDEMGKFLAKIQPVELSGWDREMELKEFMQARNMYKPLRGLMSDRFVTETNVEHDRVKKEVAKATRDIVEVERTKKMWKPCSSLCKRFNVPEPYGGALPADEKPKKGARFSVFDYLENSVNTKNDFVTPIIRPTKALPPTVSLAELEKRHANEQTVTIKDETSRRLTAQDIFRNEIKQEPVASTSNSKPLPPPPVAVSKKREEPPRTDLERKVIESRTKAPDQKKDLFKAIFESSDSEADEENEQPSGKDSANGVPLESLSSIKSAGELNVLRNTSPPRGIFASLFTKKTHLEEPSPVSVSVSVKQEPSDTDSLPPVGKSSVAANDKKVLFRSKDQRSQRSAVSPAATDAVAAAAASAGDDVELYGPSLPVTKIALKETAANAVELDSRIEKLLKNTKIVEKWVEKSDITSKSSKSKVKKSKKHKKDKKKKHTRSKSK